MAASPERIKHNGPTTRKGILPLAIILGTLLMVSSAFFWDEGKGANQQKHPNILVIFTDQWSGRALGYVGKEKYKPPIWML